MPVADTLIAGETIVFESKKHWMAPIRASLVAAAMVAGALLLRWISPDGDGFLSFVGTILDLVAIGLVIGGIGWIVYNLVAWRTAAFVVSTARVLREEGLMRRQSSTTLLASLSDVRSDIGLLGGRLGYGDIVLLTTSGSAGADRFLCITKPIEFRDAVMTQKMGGAGQPGAVATAAATPAAPTPPPAPATTSADEAETLKRLADLRDSGAITPAEYEAKKAEILARI
jgi:hypothetical protein